MVTQISRCSKLAKEYKTRHEWVGKVIHRDLCKRLKFDHTTKWYMHKPESVLENKIHKNLWDFEIKTDHLISARRPDLVLIKKKERISCFVDFDIPEDHRGKMKECKKIDKYLDLTRD